MRKNLALKKKRDPTSPISFRQCERHSMPENKDLMV